MAKSNFTENSSFNKLTWDFVDPYTGEIRQVTIGGDDYLYDNLFRTSTNTDVYYAIEYMLRYGNDIDSEELRNYIVTQSGNPVAKNEVAEIIKDARTFFRNENINVDDLGNFDIYKNNKSMEGALKTTEEEKNYVDNLTPEEKEEYEEQKKEEQVTTEDAIAKDQAYNAYWNSLYSLDDGSLGKDILDNYADIEQRAAKSNMQLAEAQYQQAALQQAEVVKSITDQVRAERMARLRSGMNEAQIANQDMQIMLNNMNNLNTQMSAMNQNRLAAQQQYNLAQDTAYQQYLETAGAMAQSAAAMAASDAGDAHMQTLKDMYGNQLYGNKYTKSKTTTTGGK